MRRLIAIAALLVAAPVQAEVVARANQSFVVRHSVEVPASPEASWQQLVRPAQWWSSAHSHSGNAANFSLDARAGGCFCEAWPAGQGKRKGAQMDSVEHARVIFVRRGKLLRMSGALGPLQGEALQATLSFTIEPAGKGTRITAEYVVGGYMRYPSAQIAPAVDQVLGEQLASLAARLTPATQGN